MCIVLLTTAHPDYALIVIDNRDEFILRPTSRPHWWTTEPKSVLPSPSSKTAPIAVRSCPSSASASAVASVASSTAPSSSTNSEVPTPLSSSPPRNDVRQGPSPLSIMSLPISPSESDDPEFPAQSSHRIAVLSARDLQRAERGTWLGITRGGNFAVLTNYRETDTHDTNHPVHGVRSRGGMVTAWMAADPDMSLRQFVHNMVRDGGIRGVGGFSLMCGKLRRKTDRVIEPLAIISNRNECPDQVPWIASQRDETVGLSNTCFGGSADRWPKIEEGKRLLRETVMKSYEKGLSEDALVESLFDVLDRDDLPCPDSMGFEELIMQFKKSIFIRPVGDEEHQRQMEVSRACAPPIFPGDDDLEDMFHPPPPDEEARDSPMGFMTGMYGTQRQTVLLVDWDGNVRFTERALFDAWGREIPRGKGDLTYRFRIDGWDACDDGKARGTAAAIKASGSILGSKLA